MVGSVNASRTKKFPTDVNVWLVTPTDSELPPVSRVPSPQTYVKVVKREESSAAGTTTAAPPAD